MDEESLRAVERDGMSGWVDGPCLWLDHKRVAVGRVNGKPRRLESEIAALKPVVYAADKTEEPVHPDAAAKPKSEAPVVASENYIVTTEQAYTLSTLAHGELITTSQTAGSVDPSHPTVSHQNVGNGAEMDTQANKLDPQHSRAESAEQAKHAETPPPLYDTALPGAGEALAAAGPGHATEASNQMHMRESLIHDVMTEKMQNESVSLIPISANGTAHRDELLVASHLTTELVLETEKLDINGGVRRSMDRFVTAVDEIAAT
jgi:hypothetical protein